MFRNRSAQAHQFSMVPRADVPRSAFRLEWTHKTTFDAGYLIPVMVEEVLPGDSWRLNMTAFGRLATPLYPVLDNLHLDSFFFFVPNRLVWDNWVKFMGEQKSPGDSIDYDVPTCTTPVGGHSIGTIYDYMGLPTVGQVDAGATVTYNVLPLRAYNLIFNEWFRDENVSTGLTVDTGDGPDSTALYAIRRRLKRHDYFTSCLPWPQKGTAVSIPLGTTAPVYGTGKSLGLTDGTTNYSLAMATAAAAQPLHSTNAYNTNVGTASTGTVSSSGKSLGVVSSGTSGLYADLSAATAATINQLRESFQVQRLLERDARGGTRYTELVRSHFGVVSPDARLQRPEYLGGGTVPILINPIAQQSGTGASGTTTPLATLGGFGTLLARGQGFTQSFTEHGYLIGIVCVRADLTYQQGLRRHWSRSTRYDYYFPAFAHLGEQAVPTKEIYCTGLAGDSTVFGYQERWAEYRYVPSQVTSLFRSTAAGTIDAWHFAQKFTSAPTLGATFMQETPPLSRVLAVGASANGQQILFDSFFQANVVRPLPAYSTPGMIDHF